jgi:AcrR family transcriptional regulator
VESESALLPIAEKRADPRYQRLMEATREAARSGYDSVSMRELAESCQISLKTIYRQFCRSKDQLIAEAHLEGLHAMRDRLEQHPPEGESPRERVLAVMQMFTNALAADEMRSRTMLRAMYALDAQSAEPRALVGDAFASMIDAALLDGVDDAHREPIVSTLAHVLNSAIVGWLRSGHDVSWVNEQVEKTVRLLFDRDAIQSPQL